MRKTKNIYVCEKHYAKDDIEFTKTGKKTVKLGAITTLNLPPKSHEVPETSRKPPTERGASDGNASATEHCFKNFGELSKSVPKMKLDGWTATELNGTTGKTLVFCQKVVPEFICKYELVIDTSMGFTVYVYDWVLPDDHVMYKNDRRSMFNVNVREVLNTISQYSICEGLPTNVNEANEHIVQHENDKDEEQRGFRGKEYFRPDNCLIVP